jgi:hypothetical protein
VSAASRRQELHDASEEGYPPRPGRQSRPLSSPRRKDRKEKRKMPSILLPAQLALHVLLLLVLAPEDMPTPPSSPSSDPRLDAEGGRARLSPAFASSLLCLLLRELLAPEGDGLSFAQLKGEILAIADETTGPEARLPAGASQTEGPRLLRQLQFEVYLFMLLARLTSQLS